MKQVYLYGFADVHKNYKILCWYFLNEEDISIKNIINTAMTLKGRFPNVEHVYAVDNQKNLKRDLEYTLKHDDYTHYVDFKNYCAVSGVKIF